MLDHTVLVTALLFGGDKASPDLPAELRAVMTLPDRLRMPFVLRVLERWTWCECARGLGLDPLEIEAAVAEAALQLAQLPRLGEKQTPLMELVTNPSES
jgi:DNA-directed RNA polymerase specialized sigma24 family protein